jgi:hypothetical protein
MFWRIFKRQSSADQGGCACPSKLNEQKNKRQKKGRESIVKEPKIEKKHVSAEYTGLPSAPVEKKRGPVLPTVREVKQAYERAKKIVSLEEKPPSKPSTSQSAQRKEKPSAEDSVLPTHQAVKNAYRRAKREVRFNPEEGESSNT